MSYPDLPSAGAAGQDGSLLVRQRYRVGPTTFILLSTWVGSNAVFSSAMETSRLMNEDRANAELRPERSRKSDTVGLAPTNNMEAEPRQIGSKQRSNTERYAPCELGEYRHRLKFCRINVRFAGPSDLLLVLWPEADVTDIATVFRVLPKQF